MYTLFFVIDVLHLTVKVIIQRMEDGKLSISHWLPIIIRHLIGRHNFGTRHQLQCRTTRYSTENGNCQLPSSPTKLPPTKQLQDWTVSA